LQTENKWLNEINEADQIDEILPAVVGAIARVGATVGRAAAQGARAAGKAASKAGKAAAKGAKKAGKAAAKKAQNVGKRISRAKQKKGSTAMNKGSDIRDRLAKYKKDKADLEKNVAKNAEKKMQNNLSRASDKIGMAGRGLSKLKKGIENAFTDVGGIPQTSGQQYDDETEMEEVVNRFRMEVRRKLIRELMEAEPAGDDGGDGKKGMNPEVAAAITKELEGQTVKSKQGKEIKVTSALSPRYKDKDPRAYKLAKLKFQKAAEDFFSKQSRKKQGGKVPKSPEDLKTKPKQDKKLTSKDTPDQKPDVKQPKPDKTTVKPESQEKQQFAKSSAALETADKNMDKANSLLARDPENAKAKQAVQLAANERFSARAAKVKATTDIMDSYTAKQSAIEKEAPSAERDQKLEAVKQEKEKAFEATGMTTKEMINVQHQKDVKDRYDASIDPAGDGEEELTRYIDGKKVGIEATRIDPKTGNVQIISYELGEDGEKIKDEDGNYNEIPIEKEWDMKSEEEGGEDLEKKEASKEYWNDFFKNQFDFSDPVDIEDALDLEFGSSSFVAG